MYKSLVIGLVLLSSSSCYLRVGVEAITNNKNLTREEYKDNNATSSDVLEGKAARRDYVFYTDYNGKPFKFEEDNSKVKYEDYTKYRNHQYYKGDKDALTSSSGNYDNGYGIYGPPDDQDFRYQGYQSPTYVSTTSFSSQGDHGYNFPHSYTSGHGHEPAPHVPAPHLPAHHPPAHNALALKGLFLPLAGVALLGAAAALVSNPVLLQLGVVTGRKKRRRRSTEQYPNPFANNKYAKMNSELRKRS